MSYRVAMVAACPFPVPQGSQVLIQNSAVALAEAGHEVHLLTYGHGMGDCPRGVKHHRIAQIAFATKTAAGPSIWKPLQDALMVRALRRLIAEHRIEIVHAHNYEGLLIALAVGHRPIVYHAHNAMADELPYFVRPHTSAARLGRWLDRTFPKRADACIALHNRLASYLLECGCTRDRLFIVPPPIESIALDAQTEMTAHPAIVYMGNLDRYQNIALLHQIQTALGQKHPDLAIQILTSDTRPIAGFETRVIHTRDELWSELSKDIVVLSTRTSWGGFPIKLANAMMWGKPVIASQSAAPGIIHGETGIIIGDNDVAGFVEAIANLAEDPSLRRRLGESAKHAARQFEFSAFETACSNIYERSLARLSGQASRTTGR